MKFVKTSFKLITKIIFIAALIGIVYIAVFQRDILINQYNKALGMYYIYEGDKALKKQELQSAISYYRSGLERYPHHYNAWFNLGNLYVLYEDYFAATDAYTKAIELNNKYVLARMNLGIISAEKIGDFDEAIEQYEEVINSKKRGFHIPFVYNSEKSTKLNRAIAYYNMGHAYRQKAIYLPDKEKQLKNDYLNKSAEAYEKALEIYGENYDASYNLALVYHLLENYNKAGINYCKAIKSDHMKFEAHYNLAILLRHMKKYPEALNEMEKAAMIITSTKSPYSNSMYVFDILNDVSRTVLLNSTDNKDGKKEEKSTTPEQVLGLVHGKIMITEEVDRLMSESFRECPEKLFSQY